MANQAKFQETSFSVGDLVKIHQKIIEGKKERLTVFQGVVIAIRGKEENKTFTVRRIAVGNIGVERIWPLNSPWLKKIEVLKRGKVRRAKLYYLRKRAGKQATKIKEKRTPKTKKNKVDEKKKTRQTRRKTSPKASQK